MTSPQPIYIPFSPRTLKKEAIIVAELSFKDFFKWGERDEEFKSHMCNCQWKKAQEKSS